MSASKEASTDSSAGGARCRVSEWTGAWVVYLMSSIRFRRALVFPKEAVLSGRVAILP